MGKNSDITSISNSISNTIVHKILIKYTNRSESTNKVTHEETEYRGQSMRKIDRRTLNNEDKKKIKDKVLIKTINKFKSKYRNVNIDRDTIERIVDEEINSFFE